VRVGEGKRREKKGGSEGKVGKGRKRREKGRVRKGAGRGYSPYLVCFRRRCIILPLLHICLNYMFSPTITNSSYIMSSD